MRLQSAPAVHWVSTHDQTLDHHNPLANPGGYEIVAFIGLAPPIATPLIGPPRRP